jgi:hypothetical protein
MLAVDEADVEVSGRNLVDQSHVGSLVRSVSRVRRQQSDGCRVETLLPQFSLDAVEPGTIVLRAEDALDPFGKPRGARTRAPFQKRVGRPEQVRKGFDRAPRQPRDTRVAPVVVLGGESVAGAARWLEGIELHADGFSGCPR